MWAAHEQAGQEQDDQQYQEEPMKVSETYKGGGDWLKADDLQGKTIPVTIEWVEAVEMENNGKPEEKFVVHFEGREKALVLNATNARTIAGAYGDETDNWTGGKLHIYAKKLTSGAFSGKSTIIAEPPPPAVSEDDDIPF